MRLLYLTFGTHSGIVTFHAEALRARGVDVECFDAGAGFGYRLPHLKLPSIHPVNLLNSVIAMRRFGREWRCYFEYTDFAFRWLSRRARRYCLASEKRFDAVLQSGVLFNGAPAPESRRIPFLLHLDHTYAISKHAQPVEGLRDPSPASSRWERMEMAAYQEADGIFSMSHNVKDSLRSHYSIPSDKITVLGGGPNFHDLPPRELMNCEAPTLLFVGKDFQRKGGVVLLEAFKKVRRVIPDAKLLIVGPKSVPLQEGVSCLGLRSHAEMPEIYMQSQIFVLPSWREPYGIAFVEAMAYGLPCVGTQIEAIPEIIDDGKTGFLIEPGDSEGLADVLLQLLRGADLRRDLGAAGREKVRRQLNWPHIAGIMISTLQSLVGKSKWNGPFDEKRGG